MLGAIIGDIVGSRFEWHNLKSKEFDLFNEKCRPTDDTVMTLAVAAALLACEGDYSELGAATVKAMQSMGRTYPRAGYGGRFRRWLVESDPKPYGSYGNGSAMRISPVGHIAGSLAEVKKLSEIVTAVTHNHPEGLKGAEAVAVAIYLARTGKGRPEIRDYIEENYYPLDFTLAEIRDKYTFDVSCQGSVPQALMAFFESTDFEDAIRNAISIGGDSDTVAAICGSVAECYYGIPATIREQALTFLDERMMKILTAFENAGCK